MGPLRTPCVADTNHPAPIVIGRNSSLGIPQDANGKAAERLIRQMTLMCCEASRVSWKASPSTKTDGLSDAMRADPC